MAPLWNLCAAAVADFQSPGRFARVSAEVQRAPRALERAALAALHDALIDVSAPRILTLSYSASVSRVLQRIAAERQIEIVCAESLPAREGERLYREVIGAGARGSVVLDTELTTCLPGATAAVLGADAVGAQAWINKAGTFGLAAAAWFSNVPVYVVAARAKAQASALEPLMTPLPRAFERTPSHLATLFLTDAGPISPDDLPAISERFAAEVASFLEFWRD